MFSKCMSRALRLLLISSVLVSLIPAALATPQPVYAASEPPRVIATDAVASFSVPSPGLFYHTPALCPPGPGPGVAAADASMAEIPDAAQAASLFAIWRDTVRVEEKRALQYRLDDSGSTACNPYTLYSNVVADENFVYWVDATGLVKLPVTANIGDTPTLMNAAYGFELPVELLDDGDRLLAVSNLPVTNGPLGASGGSYVEAVSKATGEYTVLYRPGTIFSPEEKGFHNIKTDGNYIYFVDRDRRLVRLDARGEQPVVNAIGADVSDYYPGGEVTFCPTIQCTTTDYVYYAQNNTIRRYNNLGGSDEPVQNLAAGTTVEALIASRFLFLTTLFYFTSTYVPSGGFGGTYTYSLYRSGSAPGATPELLYFYSDSDTGTQGPTDAPNHLTTDGTWLFWTEGPFGDQLQTLKRLPNDVDALPKVDMTITGMEITQGVQNDANSVRLVKGRETYVRVFVRGDADIPGATMRLYVNYGGSERGPYRPINGTHLTVKAAPDRNQVGDSFLFVLPWEASNQDQIYLRAVLNPYQVPPEPNYTNNEWTSPFYAFSPGRAIDLIFVEANYCIQKSLLDCPIYSVNDTDTHADYLRRAYPIPEGGINYRVWTINGGPLLGNHVMQVLKVCQDMRADLRSLCASDWVNAKIGTMRANAGNGINAATLTYGLITDSSTTGGAFPRGQAGTDRIGSGPAGTSIIGGPTPSYSNYGYYSGHEIGHMFGRQHMAQNSDDPATTTDAAGNAIVEGCGHSRDDTKYPYALARIGPGDGTIRGFDRAAPNSGGLPRPRVLDDVNSYDMMSYCGNAQLRWPSDYTWEGLYQAIVNPPAQAASMERVAIEGDFLSLFGVVYGEDVIVHSVARLGSVTEKTPGNAGAWRLRLLGEGGSELAAYLFDAGDGTQSEGEGQAFGVIVDFVAGTRSYEIVDVASGETRYSAEVSANVPTVTNVALDNPASPVTGTVALKWEAADADGDALTFDIFYSVDAETSYQPVVLGVSGSSAPVDTSSLAGGQGRFRVYANDGVNQGVGDSPDYTMAVKAPEVKIIGPADGEHFNWGELVNFSGEALDPQDGLIVGPSLTWANQHGDLGIGGQISVDNLPVGANVITLRAQNSAGETAGKQITIYVDDPLALPGPTLTLAPAALSFQVAAGETTAQNAAISLENMGGGTLTWSAESSAAWLTLSAPSGDVPGTVTATANPSGLPINRLHQATITFTGAAPGYPNQVVTVPVELSIGNSFVNPGGASAPDIPGEPGDAIFLPQITN
ncbi:MAG: BACON domain-containing protein [Caldilineaceae bacterium]|nr:BACON domain-containing protein [Caldilineaceae bacterium]